MLKKVPFFQKPTFVDFLQELNRPNAAAGYLQDFQKLPKDQQAKVVGFLRKLDKTPAGKSVFQDVFRLGTLLFRYGNIDSLTGHFCYDKPIPDTDMAYNRALCDDLLRHKDDTEYFQYRLMAYVAMTPEEARSLSVPFSIMRNGSNSSITSLKEENASMLYLPHAESGNTTKDPFSLSRDQMRRVASGEDMVLEQRSRSHIAGLYGLSKINVSATSQSSDSFISEKNVLAGKFEVRGLVESPQQKGVFLKTLAMGDVPEEVWYYMNGLSSAAITKIKERLTEKGSEPYSVFWQKSPHKDINIPCLTR